MSLSGSRTFVGFGFGPIQAGLFLYEAFHSGNFGRLVIAEVVPSVVEGLRRAGGFFSLNIAHFDRIETVRIGPVEVYNPSVEADHAALVDAIASADELATAIPSVRLYDSSTGPDNLPRLLARGLAEKSRRNGPPAVLYAAENHNQAAEILQVLVVVQLPAGLRPPVFSQVQFLNTVIGKMSGLVSDPGINSIATVTPSSHRAFLVEAFNHILISRITLPHPFLRGITVFEEKPNLLPFEEAKLFGHNATHALMAYLGMMLGARRVSDLSDVAGFMPFVRDAFLLESGESLIRKHTGLDPLFTPEGYRTYADDLLKRMINPFLMDTIERVARDPQRKLAWDDRLIGTMRLAHSVGVDPRRYAIGAAAAFASLDSDFLEGDAPAAKLAEPLWDPANPWPDELARALADIAEAREFLRHWRRAGFPDLARFYAACTI